MESVPAKEQQKLSTNNIYTTHNLKPKKKNLQFANARLLQKDNLKKPGVSCRRSEALFFIFLIDITLIIVLPISKHKQPPHSYLGPSS